MRTIKSKHPKAVMLPLLFSYEKDQFSSYGIEFSSELVAFIVRQTESFTGRLIKEESFQLSSSYLYNKAFNACACNDAITLEDIFFNMMESE